jgi:putative tryptophan/tyrosine transport system substrate-binding protein
MSAKMKRREFITLLGGAAAWPLAARAQQLERVRRIGFVTVVSPQAFSGLYAGFLQGMRELGHVEGRDFITEVRSSEGEPSRLPDLAAELVRLKVDMGASKNSSRQVPANLTR